MIKNDWLMTEIALLRKQYAVVPSCAELMAMFPRHTPNSVRRMASSQGLSRPLAGVVKCRPGLERVLDLLKQEGPLTAIQIGERLGIKKRAVENLRGMYRDKFRIAGWEPPPGIGKWSPKWGIANGMPDAVRPFQKKGAKSGGRKMANPFSVVAGFVQPAPSSMKGRVFKQPMDIDEWGQSRKEAA